MLRGSDVASLAQSAEEQAKYLTELNACVIDGGIEEEVSDEDLVVLLRFLTLTNARSLQL